MHVSQGIVCLAPSHRFKVETRSPRSIRSRLFVHVGFLCLIDILQLLPNLAKEELSITEDELNVDPIGKIQLKCEVVPVPD